MLHAHVFHRIVVSPSALVLPLSILGPPRVREALASRELKVQRGLCVGRWVDLTRQKTTANQRDSFLPFPPKFVG